MTDFKAGQTICIETDDMFFEGVLLEDADGDDDLKIDDVDMGPITVHGWMASHVYVAN